MQLIEARVRHPVGNNVSRKRRETDTFASSGGAHRDRSSTTTFSSIEGVLGHLVTEFS